MSLLRVVVSGALVCGVLGAVPGAYAAEPRPRMPQICQNEINASERMKADVSELDSDGVLGLDGRRIVVHGEGADWRQYVAGDQTFVARFHSMQWLVLAQRQGYPAVDLLLEREDVLPDPGPNASNQALKSTGWTEGTVRLRMGTVSCLYAWTGDTRLIPVMERLVLAGADPYRYRGLPLKRVHNHGTLANITLAEAADVFDRDDWWQLALRRFSTDASGVFSDCGMSSEQSSTYQLLNTQLWQRSLRLLEQGGARTATVVRSALERASLATMQLVRPDGVLEAIGDGNPAVVNTSLLGVDTATADTRLWCTGRGWAANRSSWDDSTTHYVIHFGPRVALHGHSDHGSVTWFSQGVPVFSDRGLYDKARGARYSWAHSPSAHSSFEPVGIDATREMRARSLSSGRLDQYVLTWQEGSVSSERDVSIPLDASLIPSSYDDSAVVDDTPAMVPMTSLHVLDIGTARSDQQWMQHWQLAPEWTALARTTANEPAAFNESAGLYLYGTCWSGLFMVPTRSAVEAFPAWRTAVPATAFSCGGLGRDVKIDTLWVVTPVKGILTWDRATGTFTVVPPPPPTPEPSPTPSP